MITTIANSRKGNNWYHPPLSHEHGVYVMLLICLVTGTVSSQIWSLDTLMAWICAFFAFQAEHPLVLQIKQRKSWKLRWLLWGGVYGAIALGFGLYLWLKYPQLGWLYLGATTALIFDLVSVRWQQQKSVINELISFAGIGLATVFVYVVNAGVITNSILGLWILNTLFFSSTIFTVKFRKPKHPTIIVTAICHAIASSIIIGLVIINWLSPWTAIAFTIALIKLLIIIWQRDWYCQTAMKNVALLETLSSLLFAALVLGSQLWTYVIV